MPSISLSIIIGAGLLLSGIGVFIVGCIFMKRSQSELQMSVSLVIVIGGIIILFASSPYWISAGIRIIHQFV